MNCRLSRTQNSTVLARGLIHVKSTYFRLFSDLPAWTASYPRKKQPDSSVPGAGSEDWNDDFSDYVNSVFLLR